MNNNILQLIKVVNDNLSHIEQLEALGNLLRGEKYAKEEFMICVTTLNSYYGYKLYTYPEHQNPDNHIDKVIQNYCNKTPESF